MKIAFANDHAGVEMREPLLKLLHDGGHEVLDFGTETTDPVDYPDQAAKAARALEAGQADRVVLVCGTGIGMSMAANKFPGVRCALCTDAYAARMAREHNDANALALRGRRMDAEQNREILATFLNTAFSNEERHQRRVNKMESAVNQPKES
jgi:ribose 5-phosphate isomerase B